MPSLWEEEIVVLSLRGRHLDEGERFTFVRLSIRGFYLGYRGFRSICGLSIGGVNTNGAKGRAELWAAGASPTWGVKSASYQRRRSDMKAFCTPSIQTKVQSLWPKVGSLMIVCESCQCICIISNVFDDFFFSSLVWHGKPTHWTPRSATRWGIRVHHLSWEWHQRPSRMWRSEDTKSAPRSCHRPGTSWFFCCLSASFILFHCLCHCLSFLVSF